MAIPLDSSWDEQVHGPRNLWSLDFGDSSPFDGMPLTEPTLEDENTTDMLENVPELHVSTRNTDRLIGNPSAVQSIDSRENQDSWPSPLVPPMSASITVPLETLLTTRNTGQVRTKSFEERFQGVTQADPSHTSAQGKQREGFLQTQLQQFDTANVESVDVTVPELLCLSEADRTFQNPSKNDAQISKSNSTFSHSISPLIGPSVLNMEPDEAAIGAMADFSVLRSTSGSDMASETSRLEAKQSKNCVDSAKTQQDNSDRTWTANQSLKNSPFREMVWTHDMHPASHRPKRTRRGDENAARLAVRRYGGACPKHKITKKAVSLPMMIIESTTYNYCLNSAGVGYQALRWFKQVIIQ